MPLLFAVTLFVSASLLFMVQPMVGKLVLPLLGGSPAVWNACMVFFQALLLLGYLYADRLTRLPDTRKQWYIHIGVMSLPVVAFVLAVMFGARVGWAFRGSPEDFSPIHVEARALYSLRQGPENNRFRPYLGLMGGYGQVDVPVTTKILDCVAPPGVSDPDMIDAAVADCKNDTTQAEIDAKKAMGSAVERELDAYFQGKSVFFGPTLTLQYLFSNESAFVFNLNVMFPSVVFQPSIGYAMGI